MSNSRRLKDTVLDVIARRPAGWIGRFIYGRLAGMEEMEKQVMGVLDPGPDDDFLEIGPGAGHLVKRALKTVQTAAGIDVSPDMVDLARKHNRTAVEEGRVDLREGDAAELPWPDDTFTCGACVNTFLFLDRPVQVLSEVTRVLKPGGRFVIITPSNESNGMMTRLFSLWPRQAHLYGCDEMRGLLEEAGCADIDVKLHRGRLLCTFTAPA